jgi:enoyl-CoA hydratase
MSCGGIPLGRIGSGPLFKIAGRDRNFAQDVVSREEKPKMTSVITSQRDGAVATITIDRAAEGNTLTIDMLRELAAAFRSAGASDARVIVLRGNGADFCRGRDTKGSVPSPTAAAMRANVCEPILDVYAAMDAVRQPVIAVVQGLAHGFGCAMAGASDVAIAADNARFRLPEMEKDLPPTLAVSALMPRVPRKALTWMVYSMAEFDAATALRLGIVSQVVSLREIDGALTTLLATMTARSMPALAAVKEFFRAAPHMEPRGRADYAANLLANVLSSAGK